jgi:cell wall-associated NlpC family hydrolase
MTSGLPPLTRACIAALAVLAAPAMAAPQGDDMEQLLAEKGLVERIQHAGATVRGRAADLVGNAMMFLGVPYKRGGNSAETGFDCSGFVRAVYEQSVGLMLPRKSSDQAAATTPIDKSELKPGDLVFFNTLKAAFSHVGIYVGDGKFVHSPRTGAFVRVEDMRINYWQSRFNGARRVGAVGNDAAPTTVSMKAAPAAAPAPQTSAAPLDAAPAGLYRN